MLGFMTDQTAREKTKSRFFVEMDYWVNLEEEIWKNAPPGNVRRSLLGMVRHGNLVGRGSVARWLEKVYRQHGISLFCKVILTNKEADHQLAMEERARKCREQSRNGTH